MASTVTTFVSAVLTRLHLFFYPQRWFIIEGNIGCGKSTLIDQLKQTARCEVIEEPVELWKSITDENGANILALFYAAPHRFAYLFQTIVFKTRMMALETPQVQPVRFSERSIGTDKHIFSESCFELGYMSVLEKKTYDTWFHWLEQKISRRPDGIIYLQVDAAVCLQRIKKRDRNEESTVSLDYLSHLHSKHELWLNMRTHTHDHVPIYVIDNSGNPLDSFKQVIDKCLRA